jgi:hypothetical protein
MMTEEQIFELVLTQTSANGNIARRTAQLLTGHIPAPEKEVCPRCDGRKELPNKHDQYLPCPECKGKGEWDYEGNHFSCAECHGTGQAPPQSDAGAELKTKISGASGFERGASCVKCLKPLSTTRGGGQPEDFWHEYYKDIITQINDDNQKLMSEKEAEIGRLMAERESLCKAFYKDICSTNQFYFPKPICKSMPPELSGHTNACLSCQIIDTCRRIKDIATVALNKEKKG